MHDITPPTMVPLPSCRLCRLADKIYLKARDASLSGDEEEAYVLFMRFYEVFNTIKSSREYRSSRVRLMCGHVIVL